MKSTARSAADLEQEVVELKSQLLVLKKSQNGLLQASTLAKVRERRLLDELRKAPEKRGTVIGRDQRELDELNQVMQFELDKQRRRNSVLQEQLRKVADHGGQKTPRPKKKAHRGPRTNENVTRPEEIQIMLDQVGEKVANTEKKIAIHRPLDYRAQQQHVTLRSDYELNELKARLRQSQTKVRLR
jgi:hypothetical protein